jgi:hypothetical protein
MGVFSANTRSQFRNFFAGRRSDSAASSETRHSDGEAVSGNTIGLTIPENGFRPVSEFDGKMMEALFTEAGGGMGGGGGLELEADDRRHGGEGSRDWGANYGAAAAAAVAGLDVRTMATRAIMGIAVASGDFSADGLFDEDNADGWSELLQSGDAARDGYGFEAAFSDEPNGDWLEALRDSQQFPNLRGHGLLPDLSGAVELNDALRQQVTDFVASAQGGTDAGFLTAVEREVTGILYGWAGLDGASLDAGGATDAGNGLGPGAMQAKFLDSYFGYHTGVGIAEVLPPEAISDMFNEVRDTAILKLAGQGPMAGLFRNLAYDADADSLTGSAAMDRNALTAFGSSAATLGPEGEAGAWRALADLTHGFESVVGSTGALTTLFAAVCGRGAELAGKVGEGMRTLGIDPGSLKVKLPGLDGENEEADSEEADSEGGEDGQDGFDSTDVEDAEASSIDDAPSPYLTSGWAEEPETGASTLDWNIQAARMDWADTPGGTGSNSTFGNLFDDYSVSSSSQSQGYGTQDYGQNSLSRQGVDLFQMPMITGFSIFDGLVQPC